MFEFSEHGRCIGEIGQRAVVATCGTTVVIFTNCLSCAAGHADTWQLLVDLLATAEINSA